MARTRAMRRLNEQRAAVIVKEILKQNPEGFEEAALPEPKVVVADKVPEYRTVQFLNGRDPGYPLDFHYHSATHYLKHYRLFHGKEYDLPVEVIEHLEQCNEPQYGYRPGPDGHPEMFIKARKYIFQLRNVPKKAAA